jgi:regulatory protein
VSGRHDWRLGPDEDPFQGERQDKGEGRAAAPVSIDQAEVAYRRALDKGLRALTAREHSRAELLQKLSGKGVSRDLAARVVGELEAQSLQSDERFAESFVHGRIERGYGPVWIRQALAQRGVDRATAEALLDRPRAFWLERAAVARERRFGDTLPADRSSWEKQARFLAQRGFPTDLVTRVLDQRD